MSKTGEMSESERPTAAGKPGDRTDPTNAELLLQQYNLLEERRKYFGIQFMQTVGGVAAIFTILVGLLGGSPENRDLLRPAVLIGGIAFIILGFLGYRLGKRQDDCERVMSQIESFLKSMGYRMAAMPTGAARFGARKTIVLFLLLIGMVLIGFGWFDQ